MTPLEIEFDREEDGRWIAEIPALPGALSYGSTKEEAARNVEALALRILADRIESGEKVPELSSAFVVSA
jgi:predicted RNase H-like HicB family nuclease